MQRALLTKVVIFAAISLCLTGRADSQLFKKGIRIGYVDIAEAFDKYKRTDIATDELKKDIEAKRKEIEKKREAINLLKQKLETQGVVIKEEEKGKMQEELEGRISELKDFTEKSNMDLRQRENEFTKDILENIKEAVNIYARENGFDIVLDKREVLYGAEGMDITKEVVDIMNKKLDKK